jgi:DNA-binding NtrC family response regulator
MDALKASTWQGNVRELRNVIERGVILAGKGPLETRHLLLPRSDPIPLLSPEVSRGHLDIGVGMTIDEAERVLIEATLNEAANNKTRAAAVLGISAKTLHMKLRQYRLEDAGEEAAEGAQAGE